MMQIKLSWLAGKSLFPKLFCMAKFLSVLSLTHSLEKLQASPFP